MHLSPPADGVPGLYPPLLVSDPHPVCTSSHIAESSVIVVAYMNVNMYETKGRRATHTKHEWLYCSTAIYFATISFETAKTYTVLRIWGAITPNATKRGIRIHVF